MSEWTDANSDEYFELAKRFRERGHPGRKGFIIIHLLKRLAAQDYRNLLRSAMLTQGDKP